MDTLVNDVKPIIMNVRRDPAETAPSVRTESTGTSATALQVSTVQTVKLHDAGPDGTNSKTPVICLCMRIIIHSVETGTTPRRAVDNKAVISSAYTARQKNNLYSATCFVISSLDTGSDSTIKDGKDNGNGVMDRRVISQPGFPEYPTT